MEDSTYYDASSSVSSTGDTAALMVIIGAAIITTLVAYIIGALFMGMMFKKANTPAWKAWVPVYNMWVFLELGGQKGWWILLALIPFVNLITVYVSLVFVCIAAYRIGLNFGKEGWFVVIYLLLGPVWFIWLAFDKTAVWNPSAAAAGNAPQIPTSPSYTDSQQQQPPTPPAL